VSPWKKRTNEEINRGTALNLGLETEQSYDFIGEKRRLMLRKEHHHMTLSVKKEGSC